MDFISNLVTSGLSHHFDLFKREKNLTPCSRDSFDYKRDLHQRQRWPRSLIERLHRSRTVLGKVSICVIWLNLTFVGWFHLYFVVVRWIRFVRSVHFCPVFRRCCQQCHGPSQTCLEVELGLVGGQRLSGLNLISRVLNYYRIHTVHCSWGHAFKSVELNSRSICVAYNRVAVI